MDDPVLSRRSIRNYEDEPVSDEHVDRLLRAAMAAPSAGNQQPWHFVLVRDRDLLRQIPSFHPYARMLETAPLAIVVCGTEEGLRWPQFWSQDCSAAVENMLIEATLLGLGGVWLGVHPLGERVDGVRRLLGIPGHIVPFAIVAVGRPGEEKGPSDRYDPSRVHRDRW